MATVIRSTAPKYAEASQTTQFTATSKTAVDKFTATNVSATNQVFKAAFVTTAQTPASAPLTVTVTIPAGKTYQFPEFAGHYLEPTDYISTLAAVVSTIAIKISLREIN